MMLLDNPLLVLLQFFPEEGEDEDACRDECIGRPEVQQEKDKVDGKEE